MHPGQMTPTPTSRPTLLILFTLALSLGSIRAAEPAPASPPLTVESVQPVLAQIAEATALGDNQTLRTLVAAQTRLPSGAGFVPYHLTLTRACLDLGLFRRALQHFRAAGSPHEFAWLAGIAYCYLRDWPRADRVILGYKHARATDNPPAYYYLTALRAFIQWTDLPAGDPLAKKLASEADDATRGYESAETQSRPGFDPRFLRLRVLIAEATGRRGDISEAVIARSRAFPRHQPFARAGLVELFTRPTGPDQCLKDPLAAQLPAAERAIWQRALSAESPEKPPFPGVEYALAARLLPADSAYRPCRLILLRAALRYLAGNVENWRQPDGTLRCTPAEVAEFYSGHGPDLVAFTREFSQLALSENSRMDAATALLWIDLHRLNPTLSRAEWISLETDLAILARDYPRALRLVLASAPAHATDAKWLAAYSTFIEEQAPLGDALVYLRRLEKLDPENPRVLLALGGLALRPDAKQEMALYLKDITRPPDQNGPASLLGKIAVTDDILTSPGARLALYQRVFAQTPQKITPPSPHWAAYRSLLRHDAEMIDLLDDEPGQTTPAKDAFTELVERCHAAAPNNPIVAEQYALLLARRAQAGFNRTTHAAFLSALAAADQAGAPLDELTRFQTAFAAHAEKSAAQARAKAEQAAADTTARLARERAAQDKDIAATRARTSAIRTLRQQLDRRREHLLGLPGAIASLKELLKGNYDPANKADFRAKIAAIEREIENLCHQCKGFGVKEDGKSVSRCSYCSGSGQRSTAGDGVSAGFESLTTPLTLDNPPAKSPPSKSGSR